MRTTRNQIASGAVPARGLTLIELLVVMGILSLLVAMLLPAVVRGKQQAHRINCLSNIRQLGAALAMYADDNEGEYPPRHLPPDNWVYLMKPYYQADGLLRCPSDAASQDWSYLLNGWNDYFQSSLSPQNYEIYKDWDWPDGMKATAVILPSETIAFGEKLTGSIHYYMDYRQASGNDLEEVEQSRHYLARKGDRTSGSNYAFADGSAQFLKRGRTIYPINLWSVTETWRNLPAAAANPNAEPPVAAGQFNP